MPCRPPWTAAPLSPTMTPRRQVAQKVMRWKSRRFRVTTVAACSHAHLPLSLATHGHYDIDTFDGTGFHGSDLSVYKFSRKICRSLID